MTNFIKPIIIFLVAFTSTNIYGQAKKPGLMFGANVFYGKPSADFFNDYKAGVGGEVLAGLGWGKTFLTGTVGASAFMAQPKNDNGTLTSIPVKVGIRHYLLAKRFFLNGDVGITSIKNKLMETAVSRFTRGVGAGVRLFGMEAGVYYDGFKNVSNNRYSNYLQYKVGFNISL